MGTSFALSGYVKIFDEKALNLILQRDEELPAGQRKLLTRMMETGPTRYLVKPSSHSALDEVAKLCPNFSEVIDSIRRYVHLSVEAEEALSFPPILLMGDPGIGKTHFAQTLSENLGLDSELIAMSSLTAGWVLSGTGHSWAGAKAGKVVRKLLEGAIANSVMIVDEIDKASGDGKFDPLGSMYQLMEKDTAKTFKDEFLDFPVDCSHLNWVCTANNMEVIPKPILSRMRVFEVRKPTKDEVAQLSKFIYQGMLKSHAWKAEAELRPDALDVLSSLEPRTIKKILWEALGESKIKGKDYVCPDELRNLLKSNKGKEKSKIGFYG